LVGEYVTQMGKVYRGTHYYQLLGLLDEAAIERYEQQWVERDLAGLAADPSGVAAPQ
jgi:hypothetical protein